MKFLLFLLIPLLLISCSAETQTPTISTQTGGVEKSETISTPLFIDVREDDEWQAGHVSGATHIRLGRIESGDFSEIPRDRPVSLYCRSGRRSGIALEILEKAGYTNITDRGGMTELQGVEIVTGE